MDSWASSPLFLGVLSGTSMDAVDVAAFQLHPFRFLAGESYAFPAALQTACRRWQQHTYQGSLDELGALDGQLAQIFAEAVQNFCAKHQIQPTTIRAIGLHGQTLRHQPLATKDSPAFSMQLGNPHIVAVTSGCVVISDFRRGDLARGGQGAPLAPLFHAAMFADPNKARCIINLGGIANLTLLLPGQPPRGFDTGPANCLLDAYCQQYAGCAYDRDGRLAATGKVQTALLQALCADPYFALAAPKSTGTEYFCLDWLWNIAETLGLNSSNISLTDMLATLQALTVQSISDALRPYCNNQQLIVYLCGGGVRNTGLSQALATQLAIPVASTAALGLAPEWVEAGLFAWLAAMANTGQLLDLQNITGSKGPYRVGISYYP
jgi:anhydro-N-acetylmuramic acid kinase